MKFRAHLKRLKIKWFLFCMACAFGQRAIAGKHFFKLVFVMYSVFRESRQRQQGNISLVWFVRSCEWVLNESSFHISIFIRQFLQGLCGNSAMSFFCVRFCSCSCSFCCSFSPPLVSSFGLCVCARVCFVGRVLLCAPVCLRFIVAAHNKSYRVSVTVATVKRTNSVQEYLTTVFITIQFSLVACYC